MIRKLLAAAVLAVAAAGCALPLPGTTLHQVGIHDGGPAQTRAGSAWL